MTLEQRLGELRAGSHQLNPDVWAIYDRCVEHLKTIGFTQGCLKPGDPMPEFALPNAEGRLVSSSELLARGPLVISFFRGDWCPYCSLELQALGEILSEVDGAGATLVAITPDASGHPLRTKRRFGLKYEVLSDVDNGLGLRFGVVFLVPDAVRREYERRHIDLPRRHGGDGVLLPIPATYIVDATGIVRHANVDPDWRRRMEPGEIVAILERLRTDNVQ